MLKFLITGSSFTIDDFISKRIQKKSFGAGPPPPPPPWHFLKDSDVKHNQLLLVANKIFVVIV